MPNRNAFTQPAANLPAGQRADFAAGEVAPEGHIEIAYSERQVALAGGERANLRAPRHALANLGYGPPYPGLMMSPRIALPLFGLGLLAAIAEADILAAADAEILAGKKLFHEAGCAACHRPNFVTGSDPARPAQSNQRIWPYTDLLLHDMGPGLADGRPEAGASGREWRTAPLWGIGLGKTVNVHTRFLHDGRARDLLEAILWHGGEAEASRRQVVEMAPRARTRLLRFLHSL